MMNHFKQRLQYPAHREF